MEKFIYTNHSLTDTICNEIIENFDSQCFSKNIKILEIKTDKHNDSILFSNVKEMLLNEINKHVNIYYNVLM